MEHDSSYHLLFSDSRLVEDLLRHFVPESWVAQLDFSTMKRVNAKLHAENLARRDGDMIYRLRLLDGTPVYVYLLLEFQSTPDPWMPLRLLVYVGLLYQNLLQEKCLSKRGRLPPVFPLVLYNGDARWGIPQTLREMIELPEHTPLWRYQPQIQYYLVDESRFPEGKPGSITGILFELENAPEPRHLLQSVEKLLDVLKGPEYKGMPRRFTAWIYHVLAPRHRLDLPPQVVESLSEVKNMLATRFDQWEEQVLQKGKLEGKVEGLQEGQRLFFMRLLERRFGVLPEWASSRLNVADRDRLEQWGLNFVDAKSLEEVFR